MKRVFGFLFGIAGALLGVLGLAAPTFCVLSIIFLAIGGLLIWNASQDDREDLEERRHQEMLDAVRQGKSKE